MIEKNGGIGYTETEETDNMRKLKVYLDTSVISYLQQDDTPEKMKDTLKLWKKFERGEYEVFLSQITLSEIAQCPEPKRSILYDYMEKIEYTILTVNHEILKLAQKIIDMQIFKEL